MLAIFAPADAALKKSNGGDLAQLSDEAVWIDLEKPTPAEDRAVERLAGIAVPTREDMQEIEISSRLYIENGARYMTATLVCGADSESPRISPITFILASHRLVTVRYDSPKPFRLVENKLGRGVTPGTTGEMVLLELLDAVIDRAADILERAGADVDQVSREIFEPDPALRTGHAKRYSDILITIGRKGDLVSKVRESLVSIGRLVTFVTAESDGVRWSKEMQAQLKTMQRDVSSLTDHASLSVEQDHLRARRHARRRQSRAEQHHQAVLGDGRGIDAADPDRLDLRHELQDHAGAAMGARLHHGPRHDALRRGGAVSVLQVEEVVVIA